MKFALRKKNCKNSINCHPKPKDLQVYATETNSKSSCFKRRKMFFWLFDQSRWLIFCWWAADDKSADRFGASQINSSSFMWGNCYCRLASVSKKSGDSSPGCAWHKPQRITLPFSLCGQARCCAPLPVCAHANRLLAVASRSLHRRESVSLV